MTKKPTRNESRRMDREAKNSAPAEIQIRTTEEGAGLVRIRFGAVVVVAAPPDPAQVRRNVEAGQKALLRASETIGKPGVKLDFKKGVPLYRADPHRQGFVYRELNGKRESGKFIDGKFVVVE